MSLQKLTFQSLFDLFAGVDLSSIKTTQEELLVKGGGSVTIDPSGYLHITADLAIHPKVTAELRRLASLASPHNIPSASAANEGDLGELELADEVETPVLSEEPVEELELVDAAEIPLEVLTDEPVQELPIKDDTQKLWEEYNNLVAKLNLNPRLIDDVSRGLKGRELKKSFFLEHDGICPKNSSEILDDLKNIFSTHYLLTQELRFELEWLSREEIGMIIKDALRNEPEMPKRYFEVERDREVLQAVEKFLNESREKNDITFLLKDHTFNEIGELVQKALNLTAHSETEIQIKKALDNTALKGLLKEFAESLKDSRIFGDKLYSLVRGDKVEKNAHYSEKFLLLLFNQDKNIRDLFDALFDKCKRNKKMFTQKILTIIDYDKENNELVEIGT